MRVPPPTPLRASSSDDDILAADDWRDGQRLMIHAWLHAVPTAISATIAHCFNTPHIFRRRQLEATPRKKAPILMLATGN